MEHYGKIFTLFYSWMIVMTGFSQTIKPPATLLVATNQSHADAPMEIEWKMHDHFTPVNYLLSADFTYTSEIVCGYDRIHHKYLPAYINPKGWSVDLYLKNNSQVPASGTARPMYNYTWQIDGIRDNLGQTLNYHYSIITTKDGLTAVLSQDTRRALLVSTGTISKMNGNSTNTPPAHHDVHFWEEIPQLPLLGLYKITVSKKHNSNDTVILEKKEMIIELKDYLVVCMGDSFNSGEGNPDVFGTTEYGDDVACEDLTTAAFLSEGNSFEPTHDMEYLPLWLEPKAHRSFKSGTALAAYKLEISDSHTSVTFVTVATSGAQIIDGLYKPQRSFQTKGQIDEVKEAVGNRRIDFLSLSIGVNDLGYPGGFSDLISAFAQPGDIYSNNSEVLRARDNLSHSLVNYRLLNNKLRSLLSIDKIFLLQIPANIFMDKQGKPIGGCDFFRFISKDEAAILTDLAKQFLQIQKQAATLNNWVYVDKIFEKFAGNNYCTGSNYYVPASSSCSLQGNFMGTLHPNSIGSEVVAEEIYNTLHSQLFTRSVKGAVLNIVSSKK